MTAHLKISINNQPLPILLYRNSGGASDKGATGHPQVRDTSAKNNRLQVILAFMELKLKENK